MGTLKLSEELKTEVQAADSMANSTENSTAAVASAETDEAAAAAPDSNRPFFDSVRRSLFDGRLTQKQVNGLDALLTAISPFTLRQQAYILATAYHETAHTMLPVEEIGRGKGRPYGTWYENSKGEQYCWCNGKRSASYTKKEYGHLFFGRGHVQLTWKDNYDKASDALGAMLDYPKQLLHEPDLALRPDISAAILCFGMRDGWFTGKKLSDYINARQTDYINARRIVNGTDKAALIADHARKFQKALELIA